MSKSVSRKFVCIGDGASGKTSLLLRFSKKEFNQDYEPTVFESYANQVTVEPNTVVKLQLYDTAGQEDFDRLRPIAYSDVNVAIMCFDLGSRDSLDNCKTKWLEEMNYYMKNVPFILTGCKLDMRKMGDESYVSKELGQDVANQIGAQSYWETSAKEGTNVEELFSYATKLTLQSESGGGGCCVIL